jgi:hypothetical protein
MPIIDLCFSGWIRGLEVTEAMDVSNQVWIPVADMDAKELIAKLWAGTLAIGLRECLGADHDEDEIEMFDYAVPNELSVLADAAFSQVANKVQEQAVQSGVPVVVNPGLASCRNFHQYLSDVVVRAILVMDNETLVATAKALKISPDLVARCEREMK